MDKIYVSINGDNIGSELGQAIASDDHEGLGKLSQSIKDNHSEIDQWVESKQGRVIVSSGDESIFEIPIEAAQELEGIRDRYKEMSGHSLTIGVGSTMSESSKALIYGKMNGKNQIVEYSPEVDKFLAENNVDEDSEIPEDENIQENADSSIEDDSDVPEESEDSDLEGIPEEDNIPASEEVSEEVSEEDMSEGDTVPEDEVKETGFDEESTEPEIDNIDESTEGEEMPEEDVSEEGEENSEENLEDISEEAPELSEDDENYFDINPDEIEELKPEHVANGDLTYQGDQQENSKDEEDYVGPQDEDGLEGDSEGEEMPEENSEEGGDRYDMLSNMIHGHLSDQQDPNESEEMSEGEEIPEDMQDGQEDNSSELKQDIFNALQGFKQNKAMLEDAKENNPELYQSLITMLRSMIQMAKQLNGYDPEEDMQDADGRSEIEESLPHAGEFQDDSEMPEDALQNPDDVKKNPLNQ
ncbi:MAG TPA: mCpol domain-containing protein [Patescibacteria group bacterium]|nr:mCpol domain-containing protein [Patescibacteria group bacterium]